MSRGNTVSLALVTFALLWVFAFFTLTDAYLVYSIRSILH